MDLVRSTAHAVGELGEVGHQPARDGVAALHLRPAVVEHNVLVPCVLEAEVDHGVGGLHDLCLVDVAEVGVLSMLSVRTRFAFVVLSGFDEPMSSSLELVVCRRHQDARCRAPQAGRRER
jgi:hypothetical protein